MRSLGHALSKYSTGASQYPDQERPMNWRAVASSLGSSVKRVAQTAYEGGFDGLSQKVTGWRPSEAETWSQWRQRRREEVKGVEKISLFPGYAVKRVTHGSEQYNHEFTVDIFVDGFASSLRPPELASRTQRAFMRLARSFAALPRLPATDGVGEGMIPDDAATKSEDEDMEAELKALNDPELLGHLPPRPDQMNDAVEGAVLRRDPTVMTTRTIDNRLGFSSAPTLLRADSIDSISPTIPHAELARLHANLDARLQPFWSSIVPNRIVRLSVFVSTHHEPGELNHEDDIKPTPLAIQDVQTDLQGYFSCRHKIPFEAICTHPSGNTIAFGDAMTEHWLSVTAQLMPAEPGLPLQKDMVAEPLPLSHSTLQPKVRPPLPPRPSSTLGTQPYSNPSAAASSTALPEVPPQVDINVPITSAKFRLISDIDDTIKKTDVTLGVKAVYRNVFVRGLEELLIPGMADWYQALSKRGVRFHYISNGPFELLSLVREFLAVAKFPTGSIKLKYYGGRSIFTSLFSGAGDRKRAGVVEILDTFPECKFFLVGDSGEQDLELYSTIAHERPQQILGIFIRDVLPAEALESEYNRLDSNELTGRSPVPGTYGMAANSSLPQSTSILSIREDVTRLTPTQDQSIPYRPRVPSRKTTGSSFNSSPSSPTTRTSRPSSPPALPSRRSTAEGFGNVDFPVPEPFQHTLPQSSVQSPEILPPSMDWRDVSETQTPTQRTMPGGLNADSRSYSQRKVLDDSGLSPFEKRRILFSSRVEAARNIIPKHIVLRVFRDPSECTETFSMLDTMQRAQ